MKSIFEVSHYEFPYEGLKFPGQHSEERILFVTREGEVVHTFKVVSTVLVFIVGLVLGLIILTRFSFLGITFGMLIPWFVILWITFGVLVLWWINMVYKKTVFIVTTRRLTKFIHTTPWTRYQMSLGLDQIVDTGAYQKGWLQLLTGLGYFVARSAAGAVKNFKIINIGFAEDLHNYINKLLFVFNEHRDQIDRFRPFIPGMKGEARDEYVRKVAPQFSKPKRELPQAEGEYLPQSEENKKLEAQ